MESIKKSIEELIGGSMNITKFIQKESVILFSVKDITFIQQSKLQSMSEIDSVELSQNQLKIILKNEGEKESNMSKNKKDNFDKLAKIIVSNVGGKENIDGLRHCITRVRFRLKDESKANDEVLNNTDGVISVVKGGGEYMIVIGNKIGEVYDAVCKVLGFSDGVVSTEDNEKDKDCKKQNLCMKVLNIVMGAVSPALNLICAGGVIKGVLAILTMLGLASDSGIYILMNAIGDAVFYFLPLFLGYNMAKNQGGDGLLGLLIGSVLVYPSINGVDINLFGYVINATYTGSFLPIILIVAIAVPVSKFLKKYLPSVVAGFLVPALTLLIVFPIGFTLIGPFANLLGEGMNYVITFLMNVYPVAGGAIFAGLYQVMVVFGIHHALTGFAFINLLSGNPDYIMALGSFCCFAQIGVVLAIYFKTKDKKLKSISLSAFFSGIFGVTEPAIYGVTLPRIKMFIISCIGAAIGGIYMMIAGVVMYNFTGLGITSILGVLAPGGSNMVSVIISAVIPFVTSFFMAFVLFKEKEGSDTQKNHEKIYEKNETNIIIEAPIPGKVIPLSNIEDETFSSGMMGHGIAIEPEEGKVYAPFDGTCVMVFETLHAIGLRSDQGVELLIHVGINTVDLDGKPFTAHVKSGCHIKKGQLLLEFDIDSIHEAGLSTVTPVIVTNENIIGNVDIKDNMIIIEKGGE